MSDYLNKLKYLLTSDLDFHDKESLYASHNFHSFPAKFPPQLPRKFILGLTNQDEIVLDPMVGSGTTVLEASINSRRGIGFDIDPLALRISKSKTSPFSKKDIENQCGEIVREAKHFVEHGVYELELELLNTWDQNTQDFIDYWFSKDAQIELIALLRQIRKIEDKPIRSFFELVFSGIIITKSGGVSLAFDLAHTRPHRAKVAYSKSGETLLGNDLKGNGNKRIKLLTKKYRSPIDEFIKKANINLGSLSNNATDKKFVELVYGNSQRLPIAGNSVDLIVTSPPYASNAIDYMRAHKFSLVWLDYSIKELGKKRNKYIGGEATSGFEFEELPRISQEVICQVEAKDNKKARALNRYYSEMKRVLSEVNRVLKPGKAAIMVVGNSIMRGISTETDKCLVEIGQEVGLEVPQVGIRNLDRNRRMMPVGMKTNLDSQIQQRMHEEYVIGFYKP